MSTSRFDYVKYDDVSAEKQSKLKAAAQEVEAAIHVLDGAVSRYTSLIASELDPDDTCSISTVERAHDRAIDVFNSPDDALVALEESYMWCGKAIRDEQIARNGTAEVQ